MWSKVSRLSYAQLVLLSWFLEHPEEYGSVESLSRSSKLKGKSLGGVLSSLARNKYRGLSLIEPWGRATSGTGLRWKLNPKIGMTKQIKAEVSKVIKAYT